MMNPADHPTLKLFRLAIEKKTVDHRKADDFNRWRNGKKCPPGSELREAADKLWAEYEAMGSPKAQTYTPPVSAKDRPKGRDDGRRDGRGGRGPRDRRGPPPASGGRGRRPSAPADCLEESFHNPYTFIPFPERAPHRTPPTPLTIDEVETDRFTGTLELEIETKSPLLTCVPNPTNASESKGHKAYRVLAIGNDVIYPATGVKGSLRSLMAIISGGTLSYLDDEVWLCQGRDVHLGPAGKNSPPGTPKKCFLAQVETPGHAEQDGTIRLGTTHLIQAERLHGVDVDKLRPRPDNVKKLWASRDGHVSFEKDNQHPYRLKLSGRPINRKGKREGLFQPNGPTLSVPGPFWAAYTGQNRHGERPELQPGDLVWLEPNHPDSNDIERAEDIESIQWARWGRRGERLLDVVRKHHQDFLPDAFREDGQVDEVNNLFGLVPRADLRQKNRSATTKDQSPSLRAFAARIRPENLVFRNAVDGGVQKSVPLAPLAPPHPGCAAFYRDAPTVDAVVNRNLPLRGYKVYRNTLERGDRAPWLFTTQGVYGPSGRLEKSHEQKVNKTCDLLKPEQTGTLRLTCLGLSERELALLLAACSVDWRLGGGKPLGLGWCRVTRITLIGEEGDTRLTMTRDSGDRAKIPAPWAEKLDPQDIERLDMWQASQEPVPRPRYPRSAVENRNKINRGGHAWFAKHATPRKTLDGTGLEALWTMGELEEKAGADNIQGQKLPDFSPKAPQTDTLFGYDLFFGDREELVEQRRNRQKHYKAVPPFDEQKHPRKTNQPGDRAGPNRKTRQEGKRRRH